MEPQVAIPAELEQSLAKPTKPDVKVPVDSQMSKNFSNNADS